MASFGAMESMYELFITTDSMYLVSSWSAVNLDRQLDCVIFSLSMSVGSRYHSVYCFLIISSPLLTLTEIYSQVQENIIEHKKTRGAHKRAEGKLSYKKYNANILPAAEVPL